jgi:hypothetical protein
LKSFAKVDAPRREDTTEMMKVIAAKRLEFNRKLPEPAKFAALWRPSPPIPQGF